MLFKRNKQYLITSLFFISMLMSCSHQPSHIVWSTRDITSEERQLMSAFLKTDREPADWVDRCSASFRSFLKPKPTDGVDAIVEKPLPELTQLNPQLKNFYNGRQYTEYRANINVMNKYPDYDEFLERTAEIIFEPVEPFGHISLRIGKKLYSFNFIQSTSINTFYPHMKNSTNPEMSGTTGYVFQLSKEKIETMEKEIEAFYKSSASHNVPPFDAYSPLLKIHKVGGGKLKFQSESPKFGNMNAIDGKIIEENGQYFLDSRGVKVPAVKKGDDFFTQSYSCSSSAAHIMEKYFGITLSYDGAAKSIKQSLDNGNMNERISPIGIIKYYEEQ
jgi:hypothetical protein